MNLASLKRESDRLWWCFIPLWKISCGLDKVNCSLLYFSWDRETSSAGCPLWTSETSINCEHKHREQHDKWDGQGSEVVMDCFRLRTVTDLSPVGASHVSRIHIASTGIDHVYVCLCVCSVRIDGRVVEQHHFSAVSKNTSYGAKQSCTTGFGLVMLPQHHLLAKFCLCNQTQLRSWWGLNFNRQVGSGYQQAEGAISVDLGVKDNFDMSIKISREI